MRARTALPALLAIVLTAACSGKSSSFDKIRRTPDYQLVKATRYGKLNEMEKMLARGASPDARELYGNTRTALMIAAAAGRDDKARLLLEKGASISLADKTGRTALHWAAGKSLPCVKLLLEKGADLGALTKGKWTALHVAASDGRAEVVKFLISKGLKVNRRGTAGSTPLHLAAWRNSPPAPAITALLDAGADINAPGANGRTPLHCAAENLHGAIVKLLLDRGANVNARDNEGGTPLHAAVARKRVWTVKLLLAGKADPNIEDKLGRRPLLNALTWGYYKVADAMMDAGVDINAIDTDGETLLITLAAKNKILAVEKLLARGAKVNIRNRDGYSALHYSLMRYNTLIRKALIAAGADVTLPGARDGRTPLMMVNFPDTAKLFISKGAKIEARDRDGTTVLMHAASRRLPAFVKLLLERGARVDAVNDRGMTALHFAARSGNVPSIKALLERGAKVNAATKNGITPMMLVHRAESDRFLPQALDAMAQIGAAAQSARKPGSKVKPEDVEATARRVTERLGTKVADDVHKMAGAKTSEQPFYVLWGRGAKLELADKKGLTALDHAYLDHAPAHTCLLMALCAGNTENFKGFQRRMKARLQLMTKAPEKVEATEWERGLSSSADARTRNVFKQPKALAVYRQLVHNVIAVAQRKSSERAKADLKKMRRAPKTGGGGGPVRW